VIKNMRMESTRRALATDTAESLNRGANKQRHPAAVPARLVRLLIQFEVG